MLKYAYNGTLKFGCLVAGDGIEFGRSLYNNSKRRAPKVVAALAPTFAFCCGTKIKSELRSKLDR